MEVVSEGSLESISRPASTSKRSSSRSSVRSTSSSVQHSMDILPPEEPSLTWSTNFEVEEDVVVTDLPEDIDREQYVLLTAVEETSLQAANPELVQENLSQSNEAAIPNDPQDRNTDTDGSERCSTAKSFENEDFDSKIREGMERIKKLDAILCNKVKREKEVKQQRLDHEHMWRNQLEKLEKDRHTALGKPVDLGPAHMLALGEPNETEDRVSEESPPVTPLFATQPVVDEERVLLQKRQEKMPCEPQRHSRDAKGDESSATEDSSKPSHSQANEDKLKTDGKSNKNEQRMKKDFIKRNILLAADAYNMVAMTEDEKKRLEEILSDTGDLMEKPVDKDSLILFGNGFVPSQEEAKQLADIDNRLQSLLPFEEYTALCEPTESGKQPLKDQTPRSENVSSLSDEQTPTFGELVLQEKKEAREMTQRLMVIEEQLQRFQNEDHNEGILSESLLRQLLDDNSRTTSQATTILDILSSTSMVFDTISSFDESFSSISSTSAVEN